MTNKTKLDFIIKKYGKRGRKKKFLSLSPLLSAFPLSLSVFLLEIVVTQFQPRVDKFPAVLPRR